MRPVEWAWVDQLALVQRLRDHEVHPAAGAAAEEIAGHTLTGAEFLDAIERAAPLVGAAPRDGQRFKRGGMPWALLKLGGLLVPMLREVSEMSYLWHVPHALDASALQRAVGPLPGTPVDAALCEALLGLGFGARRAHAQATPVLR